MKNVLLFLICLLASGSQTMAMSQEPKIVIAGPDSTVYGIAYAEGVPTKKVISANNLKPPYTLYNGQRLIIPSPNQHIAGQGETLRSIAEDYGVDVDVLARENDPNAFRQGERLSIPSRDTESMADAFQRPIENIQTSSLAPLASVKATPVPGARASLSTGAESSLPNELAAEIAREKGEKPADLVPAGESGAESSKPMLMGNLTQRNAGAPTASTSSAPSPEEDVVPTPKKAKKQAEKKKEKAVEKKEKAKGKETTEKVNAKAKDSSVEEKEEKEQAEVKQLPFIWPVQGEVIAKFKPGKNDGIKIKVSEGTPVKAAAAGDVLYAGSELKGFGNLLLLKHAGGWVTAYANNSSLLVKKGDKVKQGQVIAKSGKTGDVKQPQLHFEVRKGKQPVDPLAQLES